MSDFSSAKAKLEKKLLELENRVDDIDDDLREPGDDDWAENAIESEGDEVLEGLGNLAEAEIKQIRMALSKIEKGTYGQCNDCGESIAANRLAALPYAAKCINCMDQD